MAEPFATLQKGVNVSAAGDTVWTLRGLALLGLAGARLRRRRR